MKCSNCGAELRNGAKFCAGCGKEVKEEPLVMYCGKCGNQLQGGAKFCANCGEPVTDQGASVTNQGEPVKNKGTSVRKDSSSNRKFIIGGIGVALVVVLVLLFRLIDVHRMFLKDYEKPFYDFCKLVNERCKDNYKYCAALTGGDTEFARDHNQFMRDNYPQLLPEYVKDLEDVYGKRYKMKFEVIDVEEEVLSANDIKDIFHLGMEVESQTCYEVEVKIKIEGTYDSDWVDFDDRNNTVRVIKIKGKDGYFVQSHSDYTEANLFIDLMDE